MNTSSETQYDAGHTIECLPKKSDPNMTDARSVSGNIKLSFKWIYSRIITVMLQLLKIGDCDCMNYFQPN